MSKNPKKDAYLKLADVLKNNTFDATSLTRLYEKIKGVAKQPMGVQLYDQTSSEFLLDDLVKKTSQ